LFDDRTLVKFNKIKSMAIVI